MLHFVVVITFAFCGSVKISTNIFSRCANAEILEIQCVIHNGFVCSRFECDMIVFRIILDIVIFITDMINHSLRAYLTS